MRLEHLRLTHLDQGALADLVLRVGEVQKVLVAFHLLPRHRYLGRGLEGAQYWSVTENRNVLASFEISSSTACWLAFCSRGASRRAPSSCQESPRFQLEPMIAEVSWVKPWPKLARPDPV